MRRHAFPAVLLFLFCAAAAALGQPDTSYDVRVSLDTDLHTLVGEQAVGYRNDADEPVTEILFALIANWGAEANPYLHPSLTDAQYMNGFDPTWTRVSRVTDAGGTALPFHLERTPAFFQTFSLDAGLLVVELPAPLQPGATIALSIAFETKFARAMAMDQCVYGDTYVWRFGWHPVLIGPDALEGHFYLPAADYRVELTVPEGYAVFGGADSQREIGSQAELKTIELTNGRPARSVPLLIGPTLDSVSIQWNDVTIEAVYLPGGESYARSALSYVSDILTVHSEHFGPLPNDRLIIAENPTPGFFGLAADGMVLIGASAVRLKDMPALNAYDRLNEYLLAHELAHWWWGIGIGTDFNAENWISEGFAEYLSISYFEDQYGGFDPNLLSHLRPGLMEDVLIETMGYLNLRRHMSELSYLALLQMGFDEPIVQPIADSEYLNGLTIRTYSKGYLVLRALEALIGREVMRQVLVEARELWSEKILTVDAFHALAARISGQDLSAFFSGWIFGEAQLDVSISGFDVVRTDAGFITHLQLAGTYSVFPLTIEATMDDDSTIRTQLVVEHLPGPAATLETPRPVVRIALDPDEMLPDANRFNNHWPRKVLVTHPFQSIGRSKAKLPLDAYVIDISLTGVMGGFRNDHAWSLMVLPHIDPDMDWDQADLSLDILGAFAANVGRHLSLALSVAVTELDPTTGDARLDLELTSRVLGFTHPQTGNAGRYWYPSWQYALTFAAAGELARPIPSVSFAVTRDDTLPSALVNTVTLEIGVPGFGTPPFGTISWHLAKRFRLSHLLYVDVATSLVETLFEDLPNEFLISFSDLNAFDHLPMGHHLAFASVEVVLPPLVRNSGYAIFNWTRLDSIVPSVFIQGGRMQANCDTVCEPGIRLEAGAKLTFSFPGFLGSTISLGLGYAHPLVGIHGTDRFFVQLGGLP
jgi:hypothetical protein